MGDNVTGADGGKGRVIEGTGDDEGGLVGHEVDWEVGELTFVEGDGFGELWEPGGFEMREEE